jgi:hypothetical protein
MFGFFSSKVGCIGSILASVIGTLGPHSAHAWMQRLTNVPALGTIILGGAQRDLSAGAGPGIFPARKT